MADVVMPRLSRSMEEGTILRWLKSDGDPVRPGDELVEIETDKATETYAADGEGVLQVVAAVGETLPVGAVIARLDANGAPAAPPPAAPDPPRSAPAGGRGETTIVEPGRAQGAVARRMAESRATIPDFTAAIEAGVTAALEAWAHLDGAIELDDLMVKACGVALREQPRVNASYRDARFELHGRVNVGVAVWTEGSFVAPTLFDVDATPVAELARARHEVSERVRNGSVTSPELAGATFTVASAAVTRFTPIITPPHAAALTPPPPAAPLAVGAPPARGPAELTLACDARILVAADAAAFLARVGGL